MPFKHDFISFGELDVDTTENGRFYVTPEGNKYPSVTTVLGRTGDQTWKDRWIERVGAEEAARVSRRATNRGNAIHEMAENYLLNKDYVSGHSLINKATFNSIKPFLDQSISTIHMLETPLWSDLLRTAGRVDCVAVWDGILSIVDFKTSRLEKRQEDITNYFLQESAYAYMFYERTGTPVPQLVTVMSVDEGESRVFIERARDHLENFKLLRESVLL